MANLANPRWLAAQPVEVQERIRRISEEYEQLCSRRLEAFYQRLAADNPELFDPEIDAELSRLDDEIDLILKEPQARYGYVELGDDPSGVVD